MSKASSSFTKPFINIISVQQKLHNELNLSLSSCALCAKYLLIMAFSICWSLHKRANYKTSNWRWRLNKDWFKKTVLSFSNKNGVKLQIISFFVGHIRSNWNQFHIFTSKYTLLGFFYKNGRRPWDWIFIGENIMIFYWQKNWKRVLPLTSAKSCKSLSTSKKSSWGQSSCFWKLHSA